MTEPIAPPPASHHPATKRSAGRWLAVAAGLAVLAAAGYLITRAAGGEGGGAKSPEAAVQALADSISKEDPAGAANALAPDEARTLGDLISAVEGRARTSGLAGKSETYQGFDVEVEDLGLKVEELSDGIARVEIEGGRANWKVDRTALPGQLRSVVDRSSSGVIDRDDLVTRTSNRDTRQDIEVEPFLITVKRGAGWYVSPTYTAAAWLAEANGLPGGDFDEEVPKHLDAADRPEQAVIDLVDSIDRLDPETTLASLPSGEWSALHVYRDAIKDLIDDTRGPGERGFTFHLDEQALTVSDLPDGHKKVSITSASGTASTTDGDGDTERIEWELDGLCLEVKHDGHRGDTTCLDGSREARRRIREIGIEEPFVVVVQDRGGWVVSPMATLLEYGTEILPKVSDAFLYRTLDLERLAPADATTRLDQSVDVMFNDGGFLTIDLATPKGASAVLAIVDGRADIDGFEAYGPDGTRSELFSSSLSDEELTEAGTYRLVIYGTRGERISLRMATIAQKELPASLTADGVITPEAPVVDYRFEVTTAGTYDVYADADADAADVEIHDEDGRFLDCWQGCELETGMTYRARVSSSGSAGRSRFTLRVELPAPVGRIDGYSDAFSDTYSGPGVHRLVVPAGTTTTIVLEGSDGSIDLNLMVCSDAGGCQSSASVGADESIVVAGPFEGTVTVTNGGDLSGGDDYTINLYDESG